MFWLIPCLNPLKKEERPGELKKARTLTKAKKGIFFVLTNKPMELMMYVGNDHIDSIPLNKTKIQVPGYLGHLKRHLKEKHSVLLQESGSSAEFLVVDLESGTTENLNHTSPSPPRISD